MVNTPEQFMQMHKATVDMMHAAAVTSISGFEKLASLNMQAARASIEESTEAVRTMLEVKDVKSLSDISATSMQPAVDKYASYARHVYEIAHETGSELGRLVERQIADSNRQLYAALDAVAKTAPVGSEGMVTLVKSAMSAANTAFDQVSKATKQAAEMAEANMSAAAKGNSRSAKKAA